jgi:hypothetical protein
VDGPDLIVEAAETFDYDVAEPAVAAETGSGSVFDPVESADYDRDVLVETVDAPAGDLAAETRSGLVFEPLVEPVETVDYERRERTIEPVETVEEEFDRLVAAAAEALAVHLSEPTVDGIELAAELDLIALPVELPACQELEIQDNPVGRRANDPLIEDALTEDVALYDLEFAAPASDRVAFDEPRLDRPGLEIDAPAAAESVLQAPEDEPLSYSLVEEPATVGLIDVSNAPWLGRQPHWPDLEGQDADLAGAEPESDFLPDIAAPIAGEDEALSYSLVEEPDTVGLTDVSNAPWLGRQPHWPDLAGQDADLAGAEPESDFLPDIAAPIAGDDVLILHEPQEETTPVVTIEVTVEDTSADSQVDPAGRHARVDADEDAGAVAVLELWMPLSFGTRRSWPNLEGVWAEAQPGPPALIEIDAAVVPPLDIVAAQAPAPPEPASTPKPEWIELIESLRQDLQRLRNEQTPAAVVVTPPEPDVPPAAAPPASRQPAVVADVDTRTKKRAKPIKPAQDEWGLFDPEQCGFAALLAKLDEITQAGDGA